MRTATYDYKVAGRAVVARPPVTMEAWTVWARVGDGDFEQFTVVCEPLEFSDKLRAINPAYDITNPAFDYHREPARAKKDAVTNG